jgi:hypothetical protein
MAKAELTGPPCPDEVRTKVRRAKKRAGAAAWAKANPEKRRVRDARTYAANSEKRHAQMAAWKAANPEKCRAAAVAWRKAHPDNNARARIAAWRKAHPGHSAAWAKANPEKRRVSFAKRRALKRAATVGATPAECAAIKRVYKMADLAGSFVRSDFHVDHRQPLARGGSHLAPNLQPLPAHINLAKHSMTHKQALERIPAYAAWVNGPDSYQVSYITLRPGRNPHGPSDNGAERTP